MNTIKNAMGTVSHFVFGTIILICAAGTVSLVFGLIKNNLGG